MCDELADDATPRRVQREPVVGQQPLGHAVGGHRLVEDRDRVLGGLTGCDMGGDRVAGVVVDELEDHALASAGQDVVGGVEVPARVRGRVDQPPPRRTWPLARLQPSNAGLTEDPRQRRRRGDLVQAHRAHLLVHADRAVVAPGRLERGPHPHRLDLDLLGQLRRARPRTPGLGLEHRRWPLDQGTLAQFVEGLAGDAVLVAEGRDRPAWGVFRPLRDREADTGIDGFMGSHRRSLVAEVSPPRRAKVSPMS